MISTVNETVTVERAIYKTKADWVDAARLQASSAIFYWGKDSASLEIYGLHGEGVSRGLWISKKDEDAACIDAIGYIDVPLNCYPTIRSIQNVEAIV